MDQKDFFIARKKLEKTQKELAALLGTSMKAIHSYEQGWRRVPVHVERQLLYLLAMRRHKSEKLQPCWKIKNCPPERKKQCPAWEFQSGRICWFINGTVCECTAQRNWQEKMKICQSCEAMPPLLDR